MILVDLAFILCFFVCRFYKRPTSTGSLSRLERLIKESFGWLKCKHSALSSVLVVFVVVVLRTAKKQRLIKSVLSLCQLYTSHDIIHLVCCRVAVRSIVVVVFSFILVLASRCTSVL